MKNLFVIAVGLLPIQIVASDVQYNHTTYPPDQIIDPDEDPDYDYHQNSTAGSNATTGSRRLQFDSIFLAKKMSLWFREIREKAQQVKNDEGDKRRMEALTFNRDFEAFASHPSDKLLVFILDTWPQGHPCIKYSATFREFNARGIDVLCSDTAETNEQDSVNMLVLNAHFAARFWVDHLASRVYGKAPEDLQVAFAGVRDGADSAVAAGLLTQNSGLNVPNYFLQDPQRSAAPNCIGWYGESVDGARSCGRFFPSDMMDQITGTVTITCGGDTATDKSTGEVSLFGASGNDGTTTLKEDQIWGRCYMPNSDGKVQAPIGAVATCLAAERGKSCDSSENLLTSSAAVSALPTSSAAVSSVFATIFVVFMAAIQ